MILKNIVVKVSVVFSAASVLILGACGSSGSGKSEGGSPNVVIHELSDADMINPMNYSDAGAGYIMKHIFPQLLGIDYGTIDLIPWLAESRPEVVENESGGLNITYKIRKEAKWDNGQPVTAKDVEFSLKVIKTQMSKTKELDLTMISLVI